MVVYKFGTAQLPMANTQSKINRCLNVLLGSPKWKLAQTQPGKYMGFDNSAGLLALSRQCNANILHDLFLRKESKLVV
jgi:hypothetical protein